MLPMPKTQSLDHPARRALRHDQSQRVAAREERRQHGLEGFLPPSVKISTQVRARHGTSGGEAGTNLERYV